MATLGIGSHDEARLRALLERFEPKVFPFARERKVRSFWRLLATIRRERPDLVAMEGTGIAGGLAVMLGRLLSGVPYLVSSGDAVGPFVAKQVALLGPLFSIYERWLCRLCAGFIGWTPYLVGRAITFGAPRAMTAAGWAPFELSDAEAAAHRSVVRMKLGIPSDALVIGIVGSLNWVRRAQYCYGLELVGAMAHVRRHDVRILIVGDGDGRGRLERMAGASLGKTVLLTGAVLRHEVPHFLAAMDLASLPQSVDRVGMFRYTTKLSEYLAAGLPVVTGQVPLAYDLGGAWVWRLAGAAPWDPKYQREIADLLDTLTPDALAMRRRAVPRASTEFDRSAQVERVTKFVQDIFEERHDRGAVLAQGLTSMPGGGGV